MKQAVKFLISFVGGAVTATTVLSIWLPPHIVSCNPVVGELSPQWSLESFETINGEIAKLVDDPNITMAVIPTGGGNGYNVVAHDDRLRARLGIVSWGQSLERIENRMESLRRNKKTAEQSEAPNRQ